MHILIIHGPNLNMLGRRDASQYGTLTLTDINALLENEADKHGVTLTSIQSNHEGEIIDAIQKYASSCQGILINPGAFTHYSYAIRDALVDTQLPIVEVHLSDIMHREDFRKKDVLDGIVLSRYMGEKEESYLKGLSHLLIHLKG